MIPSAPLGTDAAADRPGLGAAAGAAPQGDAARRRFRFELAAHPGSVAQARRLTRARLSGWSVCADTCDSAALVISELVTNAIVHTASSRVVCELHDHDDTVRIAVRDWGCAPGEPHPSPARPDEEHGRGLLLVDALCRAWGAQEHGPGLLVWAELAHRADAADAGADPDEDLGTTHDTPGLYDGLGTTHDTPGLYDGLGTTHDVTGPFNDLGWGARTKPGRPDDSDEDESPEGRNTGSGRLPYQPADQPHHCGAPEPQGHGAPDPHGHRAPDRPARQLLHRTPEQRRGRERP